MFNFMTPRAGQGVSHMTAGEAMACADAGEITIVDVREAGEVAMSGKAAGALHIPVMMLQFKADPAHPDHAAALHPEKPVALYCASGARSNAAGQMLMKMGYKDVRNIGGFGDWIAAGGKVDA